MNSFTTDPKRIDWALTAWFVAGAGLLAFEGYVIYKKRPNSTLSEAVWDLQRNKPYIPFGAGFLCGHLFWQMSQVER